MRFPTRRACSPPASTQAVLSSPTTTSSPWPPRAAPRSARVQAAQHQRDPAVATGRDPAQIAREIDAFNAINRDEAARAVVREYDFPMEGGHHRANDGSDWSLGTPSEMHHVSGVHDAQMDFNGDIWITYGHTSIDTTIATPTMGKNRRKPTLADSARLIGRPRMTSKAPLTTIPWANSSGEAPSAVDGAVPDVAAKPPAAIDDSRSSWAAVISLASLGVKSPRRGLGLNCPP